MITRLFVVFVSFISVFGVFQQTTLAQDRPFPNEEAWSWYLKPELAQKGINLATDTVVLVLRDLYPNGIQAVLICLGEPHDVVELRAIAFDSSNGRYQFNGAGGAYSGGVRMRSFLMPNNRLVWKNLKYVGVEKLTKENQRAIIVPQALKKLKEAGVEVLLTPEVGQPYSFELTTMDGVKVSSKTLQGKVVLFDFWASWCAPCLQLIPDLKKDYAELRSRGFEIIGVSLDNSVDKAREATLKEKLPWPIVVAPTDKQQYTLWETVVGVTAIPRLWLVDRKGVLRADVDRYLLQDDIRRLLNE